MSLSWIFNWDLFRQCNSWKKNVMYFTNTLVSWGGWKRQQMSFLSLLPYTTSASHCFSFSCISASMDSPKTLAARAAQSWRNHGEIMGGLQVFPLFQSIWHGFGQRSSDAYWPRSLSHAFWVFPGRTMVWTRGQQTFSLKGLRANVFCFATHVVSVTAISKCCIAQAATENTQQMSVAGSQ